MKTLSFVSLFMQVSDKSKQHFGIGLEGGNNGIVLFVKICDAQNAFKRFFSKVFVYWIESPYYICLSIFNASRPKPCLNWKTNKEHRES